MKASPLPLLVSLLATASLNSCATSSLCELPEPKCKAEKVRNDLAPLALPATVAFDVVTSPLQFAVLCALWGATG